MDQLSIRLITFFAIGALSIMVTSCAEDGIRDEEGEIFILPQSQEVITTTIHGIIVDENEEAIPGAEVTYHTGLSEANTSTDDYGYFIMKEVQNKGDAAFISISSPGKFIAYRKFSVIPDRYNYTEVKMLERNITGSVSASQGGAVSLSGGATVDLPANGIVDANDQLFDGEVQVAMQWINPVAEDLAQRMIGDLSGIDENGAFRSLTTYGMLTIELMDNQGNLLNLGNDSEAELTFPIPASLRESATESIPLWTYEESIGTWIQEGIATRQGNVYKGFVSHFSSFNVDHMRDPIAIEGKVVISDEVGAELGLSYLQIFVCSENIGQKGGWLCDDGSFRFYNFPKEEEFSIKVLDRCGDEIFKEDFGPFVEDTELEKIVVETQANIVEVSGSAFACNGEVIENSILTVRHQNLNASFPIKEDGSFSFSVDFCNLSEGSLYIADLDNLLSTQEILDPSKETLSFPNLELCDEIEDIIILHFDSLDTLVFTPIDVTINDTSGVSRVSLLSGDLMLSLQNQTPLIWIIFDYDFMTDEILYIDVLISDGELTCFPTGTIPLDNITITSIGDMQGDAIEGSFLFENFKCEGQDTDDLLQFSGTFNVTVD